MKPLEKDFHTHLETLKKRVAEFCTKRNWDEPHSPKNLAIGVITEASELLELFRFCSEKESLDMLQDKETREKIEEELADTFCFLLRFAQLYHFDLTSCLEDKLLKNAKKYPANKKA